MWRSVSGGHAGDAPQLDDVALAAEGLEQPGGSDPSVGDLIVGRGVGLRSGDALIDGHDLDSPRSRL